MALLPLVVLLLVLLPLLLHMKQEVSQPPHHRLAAGDDVPRGVPCHKALQGN
jgi:hypothetical protein